jgi:hypothetical protein
VLVLFCPRCSGGVEFDDDAGDNARSRCGCGIAFSLGELRRIEWQQAFRDRVTAVDGLKWWLEPPTNGQRAGWLLVQLSSSPESEQGRALDQLRPLLIDDPAAAALVAPLLRELVGSLHPAQAARARALLDELKV